MTTELEHIIPRAKQSIEDFEPYYASSHILQQNVVPQNSFETATNERNMPPFPHHIAYHNIVASCNGRTFESSEDFTCCNRKRGDDFIPPFNLMKDSVGYLPDGTIVYLKELKNRDYFEILNLNKETLRNIRRLWYLFSQSNLSAQLLDNAVELEEIITVHAIAHSPTPIEDIKLLETFSNQTMWNAFKKYSYFLTYYKAIT